VKGMMLVQMFNMVSRSMTIMLVVVSSYSIVVTLPRLVIVAMNPMNSATMTVNQYLFYVWATQIIAPWNYCGNFFFYVLSGRQFREELMLMLCCRERPSGALVLNISNFVNGFLFVLIIILTFHFVSE